MNKKKTNSKMNKKIAVYGASRASIAARPALWKKLRKDGANIICSWIDESGEGDTNDFSELWARIESEIRSCDRLVLYIEPNDFPLKGALVEVGMALSLGKPVWVVNNGVVVNERDFKPIGSWAKHPLVTFCSEIEKACGI
jgi:hypothetical protein